MGTVGAGRERPAGDFDYERGGAGYADRRRADPRIEAVVHAALADARTVLNVGAGAGSYEPGDRYVVAVEPSGSMRAQRRAPTVPAVDATAEALPFDDGSFDAAMATVTVHQWSDWHRGLTELRRVSRGPVVVLTFDGTALDDFWLAGYVPELMVAEARRYPPLEAIRAALGGTSTVATVPVANDCTDGFTEAFYARPERLLDPEVRRAQSAWGFVDPATAEAGLDRLRSDLASGAWDSRYGRLRDQPTFAGSLRLITALPDA